MSQSNGHTPGPWVVDDTEVVCASDQSHIAEVPNGGRAEQDRADRALIAAAPELVEALEDFVRDYAGMETGDGEPCPTLAKARAAISKARGDV